MSSTVESPKALSDDLPQFSLSPLPYITEVTRQLVVHGVDWLCNRLGTTC